MLIALYVLLALVVAVVVFAVVVAWKVSGTILYPRVYAYDTVVDEEEKRGHFTRKWFEENVRLEELRCLPRLAIRCIAPSGRAKTAYRFPTGSGALRFWCTG